MVKCPRDRLELEGLIMGLVDLKFDHPLVKKPVEDNTLISKIISRLDYQEDVEIYKLVMRWGETREEALRNYIAHFTKPCSVCIDNYVEILLTSIKDEVGVDEFEVLAFNSDKLNQLMKKFHDEKYLGRGLGRELNLSDIYSLLSKRN